MAKRFKWWYSSILSVSPCRNSHRRSEVRGSVISARLGAQIASTESIALVARPVVHPVHDLLVAGQAVAYTSAAPLSLALTKLRHPGWQKPLESGNRQAMTWSPPSPARGNPGCGSSVICSLPTSAMTGAGLNFLAGCAWIPSLQPAPHSHCTAPGPCHDLDRAALLPVLGINLDFFARWRTGRWPVQISTDTLCQGQSTSPFSGLVPHCLDGS